MAQQAKEVLFKQYLWYPLILSQTVCNFLYKTICNEGLKVCQQQHQHLHSEVWNFDLAVY